jgi:ABC-type branched-subunit amino acid transport system substrate-binding protein
MKTTFSLILIFFYSILFAQVKKDVFEVGLFSTLYLDQQFNSSNELNNPRQIFKNALPSLEFYEGASLAIDSLNAAGKQIKLTIFDTQSFDGNISRVFEKGTFEKLDLIISQLSGDAFFQLAIIAQEMNIPIVNATYPNSKGIQSHPGLFITNPRINSHLEVLHKKLTVNWKNANIIWFRRDNQADIQIENLFKNINQNSESTRNE